MKIRTVLDGAAVSFVTAGWATVAGASFLPYRVLTADFGVSPGSIGQPITWSGPGDSSPFHSPAGGLNPPHADSIDSNPRLRWDSYFMSDPVGASFGADPAVGGDGHSAQSATGLLGASIDPGMVVGTIYNLEPGLYGGRYAGPEGRLYLLNITLRASAGVPTTAGIFLGVVEDGAPVPDPESYVYGVRFGAENAVPGINVPTNRRYYLDWIATPVPASELPASFGPGINYQIYVQQLDLSLPSPGTAALALFGLAFLRRRR